MFSKPQRERRGFYVYKFLILSAGKYFIDFLNLWWCQVGRYKPKPITETATNLQHRHLWISIRSHGAGDYTKRTHIQALRRDD